MTKLAEEELEGLPAGERPEGAAPHAEADEARGGAEGRVPDAGADARGLSEGVCVLCVWAGVCARVRRSVMRCAAWFLLIFSY